MNSGQEYNLLGKAYETGAIASGQITTSKNPGSDEQDIEKARASPNRMANSMDRSTFRQEQSNERMNEQSSLQLIPYLESDKTQLMIDESNQAGASGTGPLLPASSAQGSNTTTTVALQTRKATGRSGTVATRNDQGVQSNKR